MGEGPVAVQLEMEMELGEHSQNTPVVSQGTETMSTSVHTSTVHFPSHPLAWDQHHCAAILLSPRLEPGSGLGIEADLRCR